MPEMRTTESHFDIITYPFPRWEYPFYFRTLWECHGWRSLIKQFRPQFRRRFSRKLIYQYAPHGIGLEIGVGAYTIAPVSRTILSDGFQTHGQDRSLARVIFKADHIPYGNDSFDFILSEHALEHLANPLKALLEWKRALKVGAKIILFLPQKERTFDRSRSRTLLTHLIRDYENKTGDDDKTHLDEWYTQVIQKGLAPHYSETAKTDLIKTGNIHHHVWITEDLSEIFSWLGLKILYVLDKVPDREDSFVIVGEKR